MAVTTIKCTLCKLREEVSYTCDTNKIYLSLSGGSEVIPFSFLRSKYPSVCPFVNSFRVPSTHELPDRIMTLLFSYVLETPGQPVVKVNTGDIKARSALVTWSYSPGVDEMPVIAYYLEYQNSSFKDNMSLGGATSKQLMTLKPYTTYRVRLVAASLLGKGLWTNLVNFVTKTDGK